MPRYTDTERLDFLESQSWTRWVGYDHPTGKSYTSWPVFAKQSFREELDKAITASRKSNG